MTRHQLQFYSPDAFAHGFCILGEVAESVYGSTTYYDPSAHGGFLCDEADVGIEWPTGVDVIHARGRQRRRWWPRSPGRCRSYMPDSAVSPAS
jgi:dTDP-4-dehydrorhamnose 3,5-epimerase-like enzyme